MIEWIFLAQQTSLSNNPIPETQTPRIDYVEFVPVAGNTTPPDPTPPSTGNTVDYSNASKGIHANLEQKVGYIPDLNQVLKLMCLGDSITRGKRDNNEVVAEQEGYRKMLWESFNMFGCSH